MPKEVRPAIADIKGVGENFVTNSGHIGDRFCARLSIFEHKTASFSRDAERNPRIRLKTTIVAW